MATTNEPKDIAEQILTDAWDTSIQLQIGDELGGSDRSHVYRCTISNSANSIPQSVIVKQTVSVDDEKYEPDQPGGSASRLFNDWAGLQFLTELANETSPAPRFYGGNREVGIIVLEDLGACAQLDHLLLADDIFANTTETFGLLESTGATLCDIANKLRTLWPQEADAMPIYPAFRT